MAPTVLETGRAGQAMAGRSSAGAVAALSYRAMPKRPMRARQCVAGELAVGERPHYKSGAFRGAPVRWCPQPSARAPLALPVAKLQAGSLGTLRVRSGIIAEAGRSFDHPYSLHERTPHDRSLLHCVIYVTRKTYRCDVESLRKSDTNAGRLISILAFPEPPILAPWVGWYTSGCT